VKVHKRKLKKEAKKMKALGIYKKSKKILLTLKKKKTQKI